MYIPKSKIQTNLYTEGNEYVYVLSGEYYAGYYYSVADEKFYTGKNPNVSDSKEIVPAASFTADSPEDPDNYDYAILTLGIDSGVEDSLNTHARYNFFKQENNPDTFNSNQRRLIPPFTPVLPTQKDYDLGVFVRYFCKKRNENIYIEIDENIYNRLVERDPTIAFDLYRPFKLNWTLTSSTNNENEVGLTNSNMVKLISVRQKAPGLDVYLKFDYTKYYQSV